MARITVFIIKVFIAWLFLSEGISKFNDTEESVLIASNGIKRFNKWIQKDLSRNKSPYTSLLSKNIQKVVIAQGTLEITGALLLIMGYGIAPWALSALTVSNILIIYNPTYNDLGASEQVTQGFNFLCKLILLLTLIKISLPDISL